MKKTARTLLTAAIFATALGSAAPSQFRQPVQALGDPVSEVMTGMAVLYGPPPALSTTSTARTRRTHKTTEPTEPTTFTMTVDTAPVVLYGPPWVFYPTGDANMDNKTDARDLTFIKQIALGNRNPGGSDARFIADIDHDNDVDKDDVEYFMKEVLGIPEKEEENPAVTTTAIETTAEATTATTTKRGFRKTTAPGEVTLDPAILTGLINITDAPIIALYGPPNIDWDDQLRWDTYEDLHPGEGSKTSTTAASDNKTTKTETVEEANRHKDS
ncbi:MAG: hypothetical protein IKH27_13220 [Oscillospiraceae bacterium]|nr:hypothetical protein [Oscillospiraceae bacterium]